jgi:hypothetical protein
MVSASCLYFSSFKLSRRMFHRGAVGKAVGSTYVSNKCAPNVDFSYSVAIYVVPLEQVWCSMYALWAGQQTQLRKILHGACCDRFYNASKFIW